MYKFDFIDNPNVDLPELLTYKYLSCKLQHVCQAAYKI